MGILLDDQQRAGASAAAVDNDRLLHYIPTVLKQKALLMQKRVKDKILPQLHDFCTHDAAGRREPPFCGRRLRP